MAVRPSGKRRSEHRPLNWISAETVSGDRKRGRLQEIVKQTVYKLLFPDGVHV